MRYIWQNKDWPAFIYDSSSVSEALALLEAEREKVDYAYSLVDKSTRNIIMTGKIAEDIVSSLAIEGEAIDYGSLYSSVAKHLDVVLLGEVRKNSYAESVFRVVTDAVENKEDLTHERLFSWNKGLFLNKAGIKPKVIGAYRTSPEWVMKYHKMEGEVVYEAVNADSVRYEMEKLLEYVNGENGVNPFVKAAVASLWFVLIHPFEDGNGRISRALADYIMSRNYFSSLPLPGISTGILRDRAEYYEKIENASKSESMDITGWVLWFLGMIRECFILSKETLRKTLSVTAFMKSLDPNEYNSREMSMLYRLSDGSFYGKVTTEKWARLMKCSNAAAYRDIQHLVRKDFLIPSGGRGRSTSYSFDSNSILMNP